ncbi:MAG: epimerase [Candidatus Magasanikbacteria bacterium CG10_big_fil_rev_8_21_14_0_10_36_32]|uniref:Epimerase n=1 Tax=Candidatus Magasanikbacteria bacterium CG10_big_fil_rev_8_21_14_0_10_36_32 TaxID=1974646 RepID=A0A2M6W5U2_9BACT|nr:MAG: epimerase [Candidatus Magasanikbacteria bacterium CG10_big_fil_rev_8_21_14_0_10_36_32]
MSLNKVRTILLTGATGYLGSNILKLLVKDNQYKVVVLKRTISNIFRIKDCLHKTIVYDIDKIEIEQIFLENKIDIILHCATDYGRKNVNPLQIIDANLNLPVKLLEMGRTNGVKCFINTDTILDKRINHYSLSKKQFKEWLLSYKNNLICINVALEHFYGPGDDKTKFVSHVVDGLINQIDKIDFTKGEQKRDFVYIDDVVDAFIKIINHSITLENGFYEFQIGSEKVVTIKEFVSIIKNISGNIKTVLDFGALPYRENEVMECVADTAEIKKLGWISKYSLQDGLSKMIEQELILLNKKI